MSDETTEEEFDDPDFEKTYEDELEELPEDENPEPKRKRWKKKIPKSSAGSNARKSTTGRFNDANIGNIAKYVRAGYTDGDACHLAGINPLTFRTWMSKGLTAEKGKYRRGYVRIQKARIKREGHLVGQIEYLGGDDWKAPAWLLERTSKRYSKQGEPERAELNIAELTDAEIGAILLRLHKLGRINHAVLP